MSWKSCTVLFWAMAGLLVLPWAGFSATDAVRGTITVGGKDVALTHVWSELRDGELSVIASDAPIVGQDEFLESLQGAARNGAMFTVDTASGEVDPYFNYVVLQGDSYYPLMQDDLPPATLTSEGDVFHLEVKAPSLKDGKVAIDLVFDVSPEEYQVCREFALEGAESAETQALAESLDHLFSCRHDEYAASLTPASAEEWREMLAELEKDGINFEAMLDFVRPERLLVHESRVDGDRAFVVIRNPGADEAEQDKEIQLERLGGQWKVSVGLLQE